MDLHFIKNICPFYDEIPFIIILLQYTLYFILEIFIERTSKAFFVIAKRQ